MRWPWSKPEPITVGEKQGYLDVHSDTWIYVRRFAMDEIEKLRKKNDSPILTPEQTASIRGEIKAMKKLADLPNIISSRDNRLKRNRLNTAGEEWNGTE